MTLHSILSQLELKSNLRRTNQRAGINQTSVSPQCL
jgi:hypothetical protein